MKRSGVVTAKSQYGIMLDNEDQWFNWSKNEEHRGTLQDKEAVQKGDAVRIEHEGRWINGLEFISQSQDVTPETASEPREDGQFRSPLDFRRTSALAQSVAYYVGVTDPSVDDVINTAARFEKYLEGGYERS